MVEAWAAASLGKRMGARYRLDRVLGAGGIGVVFAGVDEQTGRPVAVKVLRPEQAERPSAVERFLREARNSANLRHPNFVEFLDAGLDDVGRGYLVLELLEGGTLEDRLAASGPLGEADSLATMVPIVHAVGFAHGEGVVHRDLKPGNIFLARAPQGFVMPKVVDFGLSRSLLRGGPTVTRTGAVIGSPGYMAPEQINRDAPIGPPADVWALGLVLLECLTARRPWKLPPKPSLTHLLATVASQRAMAASAVEPTLRPALADIIDRCLLREPGRRFADARELASALQAVPID